MNKPARYLVIKGSKSAHCCFTHTVVDTMEPVIGGDGKQMVLPEGAVYETICECFCEEDADTVCAALNALEGLAAPTGLL